MEKVINIHLNRMVKLTRISACDLQSLYWKFIIRSSFFLDEKEKRDLSGFNFISIELLMTFFSFSTPLVNLPILAYMPLV